MEVETLSQSNKSNTGTLIFLHGATRNGPWQKKMFLDLLGERAQFKHIKIIFPSSPVGYFDEFKKVTNIWFNIKKEDGDAVPHSNLSDIEKSAESLRAIILKETENGIPLNRIVIGGISQGAMLSFHVVYRLFPEVAACISVAGCIPQSKQVYEAVKSRGKNPPVYFLHGTKDPIIPIEFARSGEKDLTKLGVKVEFHEFPEAPHELTKDQLDLIYQKVLLLIPE